MNALRLCLPVAIALASAVASAQDATDAAILPPHRAGDLLDQCSRAAPAAGDSTWLPSATDIAALEAALPAALAVQPAGRQLGAAPAGWRRQYVGLVRGGRRYVYGNFFPADVTGPERDGDRWRREPVIVCDGGPAFFGVEFDVEAGRFTHFGFNGSA